MTESAPSSVSISCVGIASSLGLDANTVCAAIRGGLNRAAPLEGSLALDFDTLGPAELMGHPAGPPTLGFTGVGRWLQLASYALDDLCRAGKLPGADDQTFWSRTELVIVTPVLDIQRVNPIGPMGSEAALEKALIQPLLERHGHSFKPATTRLETGGRAGLLGALKHASESLQRGASDRVAVLTVDSLVDAEALDWLAGTHRLKSDETPSGFMPGEAACGLLLEGEATARARGVEPAGGIEAMAMEQEELAFIDGERSQGAALANVVRGVLEEVNASLPFTLDVVSDMNGEEWRAYELGSAFHRLANGVLNTDHLHLPASSIGDPGAPMLAIQIALALHAYRRGYARGNRTLAISSDEYGAKGAVLITSDE